MTTLLKQSLQFILALVLSRANRTLASNQDDSSSYEFCIVGAGAAGIQLSRFLQLANRNFIVLERHDQAGSFFTKYPKQEGLISINKKYTGHSDPEFNLRHDWNSLLTGDDGNSGTELKFTDLTDEYWPHRSYLVEYLNLFVEKYELGSYIQYQTNVDTVQKKGSEFYIEATQTDKESNHTNVRKYTCEKLIWATGFSKPRTFKSNPHGWNIVPYHEMGPASEYKNKTVTILGAGQSAFEAARALYKVTADTQIVYRTPPKFAYLTHYPGDIRVMNQEILDSYQLKSLDALTDVGKLIDEASKYHPTGKKIELTDVEFPPNIDVYISCIGWAMDQDPLAKLKPDMMTVKKKSDQFPDMDPTYQSKNVEGLYFAGVLTHGNDKDRSAGGFVHGFRYTTRALSRMLLATESEPWPMQTVACWDDSKSTIENVEHISREILKRVGITSGLYQMQSELQDIFLLTAEKCLIRLEEVPQRYTPELVTKLSNSNTSSVFTMTFRYNHEFSHPERYVWDRDRVKKEDLDEKMPEMLQYQAMPNGWDEMNFLHPVLETLYYSDSTDCKLLLNTKFHMMEDIATEWKRDKDLAAVMEWLLVRTLSNPCDFDSNGVSGEAMKAVWKNALDEWFGMEGEEIEGLDLESPGNDTPSCTGEYCTNYDEL